MKIAIQPTGVMTQVNGARCRVWDGVTERGIAVKVMVAVVAVREDLDQSAFQAELEECGMPRSEDLVIPMRHIL